MGFPHLPLHRHGLAPSRGQIKREKREAAPVGRREQLLGALRMKGEKISFWEAAR